MKRIFLIVMLLQSIFTFSQNTKASKAAIYASIFGSGYGKEGRLGAGAVMGLKLLPQIGIGVGIDAMQVGENAIKVGGDNNFYDPNKFGTNIFAEARLIIPAGKFIPSFAFQYGKFAYANGIHYSGDHGQQDITNKGKQSIGGNVNFCFSPHRNGKGFSIGYSYRSINFASSVMMTNILRLNSGVSTYTYSAAGTSKGQYNIITFGYNF